METIEKVKEVLKLRNISAEELRIASKMSEKPFNDVMEGKRIMPQYMIMKFGELTGKKWKEWEALQNKEIYDKDIKIGDRGLILN